VLPVDPFELGGDRRQRRSSPLVLGVRLELDAQRAGVLERVPQEQVLRLGVRARAPGGRVQPRVPDLQPAVLRSERQVARRANDLPVARHRERPPVVLRPECVRDPEIDVSRPHPAPRALVGRGLAQAGLVLGHERLERHDPPRQARCETFEHD
jgi:hypothetical protein